MVGMIAMVAMVAMVAMAAGINEAIGSGDAPTSTTSTTTGGDFNFGH